MAERDDDEDGKNKNASALSALGASKGGKERAKRLSPEQRKAIATSAAITRWGMEPVRAVCDGFLKIGDIELACANLPDGRRVIAEITMLQALKRGYSGYYSQRDAAAPAGSAVPPRYLSPAFLRPFISEELKALQPIPYVTKSGVLAKGVEASAVPQICEVWLKARDAGKLNDVQLRTAAQAEIILRGLARVGITALIDEATGFQEERERNALAKILERFIAKELQPWAKTFPWTTTERSTGSGIGRGRRNRKLGHYRAGLVLVADVLAVIQACHVTHDSWEWCDCSDMIDKMRAMVV
jgi:hypothetical protein